MKYCEIPFKKIHIYPGGNVKVCSWTTKVIGNMLSESIDDIWNGEKAEKIRETVLNGSFEYCNKTGCPFCENNSLPELTEEELKIKAVKSEIPTVVNAAFDYTCNHSCPSCRDEIYKPSKEYVDEVKFMADTLLPIINKGDFLSTNGNGDFFASPYIMEMLSKVKSDNPNFGVLLETNGALFTRKNWEKIKHLGQYNLNVIVTPNSFERSTYKYLSGGHDNLDTLLENLYFIKELREQNIINRFEISIVMQERNFSEVPAFTERCLKEYNADQVVIKPIYKWFRMSDEAFWFKDILNPLHPYHKEVLELRKNPILHGPKVYWWGADNIREPREYPTTVFKTYLTLFARLMSIDNPIHTINQYLRNKYGYRRIALYGLGPHTELLHNILKESDDIEIPFILYNKYYDNCNFGKKMLPVKELDQSEIDAVIIVNYPFFDDVKTNFVFYGITKELLPLDKLVEEVIDYTKITK